MEVAQNNIILATPRRIYVLGLPARIWTCLNNNVLVSGFDSLLERLVGGRVAADVHVTAHFLDTADVAVEGLQMLHDGVVCEV